MSDTMKALVKPGPEPGLVLEDRPIPLMDSGDVRIRVQATSVCGTDLHIYNWDRWAQSKVSQPLIVGHEFCGEVIEVGSAVTGFKVGDRVAAESHVFCGTCRHCTDGQAHICENEKIIGVQRDGCFAEQIVMPERCVWKSPEGLPVEIATLQEPLGNSVHVAMAGSVAGKDVLVTGCGPTGLFSIAIARKCGARSVIGIDVQPYRLELARVLGADDAWNPVDVDVVDAYMEKTAGKGADVVFEMSGNDKAIEDGLRCLARGGDYRFFGVPSDRVSLDLARDVIFKGAILQGIIGRKVWDTWKDMSRLLEEGLDLSPIVTHRIALEDYETAFELIRAGQCGKVVMFPGGDSATAGV